MRAAIAEAGFVVGLVLIVLGYCAACTWVVVTASAHGPQ